MTTDLIEEKVSTFVDRLELLFESFGLAKAQGRLASMRKSFKGKDGYLWTIDDPPWRQGQYGAVAILEELVDNYLFAYSDVVGHDFRGSNDYQQLVQLLLGVERSLSVTQRYPANEIEFQRMVDSILICRFTKLTHPNLPTAIMRAWGATRTARASAEAEDEREDDNHQRRPCRIHRQVGDLPSL